LVIVLLFKDKYLYLGLLAPINPGLINLTDIGEALSARGVDTFLLNNLCHSIIAGIALYQLWLIGSSRENEK